MNQRYTFDQIFASFRSGLKQRRKRTRRKQKRWTLALTALLVVVVSLTTAGITYASLNTKTNTEINRLGFGQAKISVNEVFNGWTRKEVKLVIEQPWDGLVPGVARVMFVPYVLDSAGINYIPCDLGAMTKPNAVTHEMILGDLVLEFAADWESHWFYKDGYFYYKQVLYPETGRNETPVLLKKVSFSQTLTGLIDKYGGSVASIKVEVLASILQAGGSAGEPGKVLETEWGVKVIGNAVSPY